MALIETQATSNIYNVMPTVIWVVFLAVVVFWLKEDLKNLISHLASRVRLGAPVKIASFELGSSYVAPGGKICNNMDSSDLLESRVDEEDAFYREAERFRAPTTNIFLVHRLAPSKEPGQLYDILIYLHPHKDMTLAGVKKVEYYFGRYWDSRVFTSSERSRAFSITTSAYGPFVCTAKLHFSDGNVSTTWRYIDFEMGSVGVGLDG